MVDSFGADEAFLHSKMLQAYVRRLVNDSNDVAEIMQEVGLRILELRDRQIEWDESGGWCRALTCNVVAHFHRSKRRRNVLHATCTPPARIFGTRSGGLRVTSGKRKTPVA